MKTAEEYLKELQDQHPYREIGKPETYSQYNEGWSDALDLAQSVLEQAQKDAYNEALEDVYGYSLILSEPVDPDDDYNVRETSYLIMIDDFKKIEEMSRSTENTLVRIVDEEVIGIAYRGRNRKVSVLKRSDGLYLIRFIRTTAPEERNGLEESDNVHLYRDKKIMVTDVLLTKEGLESLFITIVAFFREDLL